MAALPSFTRQGVLPPGDYTLTLAQLASSMLVTGPAPTPKHWDVSWRGQLVKGLAVVVEQLRSVGMKEIFINGSFVEDKDHPNDIDGYFECDANDLPRLVRELNMLDPHKVWTWSPESRRSALGSTKRQLPMWHHYRVELYPHVGQLSGICDRHGNELEFPAAFRKSRSDDLPKGIVRIGDTA